MKNFFTVTLSALFVLIQANISYSQSFVDPDTGLRIIRLDQNTKQALYEEAYDSYVSTYVVNYCRARAEKYRPTPAAEYAYERAARVFNDLTRDFFTQRFRSELLYDLRSSKKISQLIREYCPEYPF